MSMRRTKPGSSPRGKESAVTYSLESRRLTSVPRIPHSRQINELKLSNNPLVSLEGLPSIPTLEILRFDDTQVGTFKGAVAQPGLRTVSAQRTPVSLYQTFRVMAVIVFGDNVEVINQVPIKRESTHMQDFDMALKFSGVDLTSNWVIEN